jgi:hypothetical protein
MVSPSFNCADALAPENKIAIARITLVLNMPENLLKRQSRDARENDFELKGWQSEDRPSSGSEI